jgi:CheY-like chemotaxis protein
MKDTATILIVEDVPACVDGLCAMLKDIGVHVMLVNSRTEAEDILSKVKIDLLLLDIYLMPETEDPHVSGLRLMQRLRNGECGSINTKVPVFVLTGYPEMKIEDELLEFLAVKNFWSKPQDEFTLYELIRTEIGR